MSGSTVKLISIENVIGSNGDDTIRGDAGNNEICGGLGDEYLVGDGGDDTYRFSRGDGTDSVENRGDTNSTDRLLFDSDITSDQLWFTRNGDKLNVQILGSTDSVDLFDWYNDADSRVDQIEAGDGTVVVGSQVQQLVDAMAAFALPSGSDIQNSEIPEETQQTVADVWSSSQDGYRYLLLKTMRSR